MDLYHTQAANELGIPGVGVLGELAVPDGHLVALRLDVEEVAETGVVARTEEEEHDDVDINRNLDNK
jgi:hypothetical protein